MFITLIVILIGLILALLFVNVYFRVKVFKVYKNLVMNKVEFNSAHIFDKKKMESEIIPKYPKMETEIRLFVEHIRFSIAIAIIIVLLISIFALISRDLATLARRSRAMGNTTKIMIMTRAPTPSSTPKMANCIFVVNFKLPIIIWVSRPNPFYLRLLPAGFTLST